jgi:hypothetical protein
VYRGGIPIRRISRKGRRYRRTAIALGIATLLKVGLAIVMLAQRDPFSMFVIAGDYDLAFVVLALLWRTGLGVAFGVMMVLLDGAIFAGLIDPFTPEIVPVTAILASPVVGAAGTLLLWRKAERLLAPVARLSTH